MAIIGDITGHRGLWTILSTSQEICTWFMFCLVCCGFGTGWFYLYSSGLLHCHWGNLKIAPVPVKQPWGIKVIKSHEYTELTAWPQKNKTKQNNPSMVWSLKSPAIWLFIQQLVQRNLWKKLYITGPLCGESTSELPSQRGSNVESISMSRTCYAL